jgi:hypothetical protein
MAESQVTVQYERKLSDGNYGSEGLSLSITYSATPEDLTTEYLLDRADWVRRVTLAFLTRSTAARVKSAAEYLLNPPAPKDAVPVGDSEGLEDLPF